MPEPIVHRGCVPASLSGGAVQHRQARAPAPRRPVRRAARAVPDDTGHLGTAPAVVSGGAAQHEELRVRARR